MLKKGLLFAVLLLFIAGCAGAIQIAEEEGKGSTIAEQNILVKPQK